MQLTATLTLEELTAFFDHALPVRIELSADHFLYLGKISRIRFVAGRGVELEVHAKIRWPVIGLHIPIEVKSAVVMLRPSLEHVGQEDVLAFRANMESLDVAHAPELIERPILHKLNEAMTSPDSVMCWRFRSTLNFDFPLPATVEPRTSIALAAGDGGTVTVTDSALTISVPFLATAMRAGELGAKPSQEEDAKQLHTP